jgi:hypothetical protein
MKPSEIIRKGRSRLFQHGWCQHSFQDTEGRLCAFGALRAATSTVPESFEDSLDLPTQRACLYLEKSIGPDKHWFPIVGWNDEPGRTFSEVVDLFDKAEKLAEADEA